MQDLDPVIARLSVTVRIAAVPCVRGAYNFRLYRVETGEIGGIQTLYFADYTDSHGWSGTDILFNIDLDDTGRLSAFAKGRGLGDCGSFGLWQ